MDGVDGQAVTEPQPPELEGAGVLLGIIGVSNRLIDIDSRLRRIQRDLRRPRGPVSLLAVMAASALGVGAVLAWWSLPKP